MPETLKICKYNVSGTGYCDIFDDYCHEGPCSHETLVEYVAVVRCRECKYSRTLNNREVKIYLDDCRACECSEASQDGYMIVFPDHFCSYGERRDDNDGEP